MITLKKYNILEIPFNDLLYNTEQTVQKIHQFLPFLKNYNEVHEALGAFLDPDLKHHKKECITH